MGWSMISNMRLSPSLAYMSPEATSNRQPLRRSSLVISSQNRVRVAHPGESSGRRIWHNSHSEGLFDLNQYSNAGGGCRLQSADASRGVRVMGWSRLPGRLRCEGKCDAADSADDHDDQRRQFPHDQEQESDKREAEVARTHD